MAAAVNRQGLVSHIDCLADCTIMNCLLVVAVSNVTNAVQVVAVWLGNWRRSQDAVCKRIGRKLSGSCDAWHANVDPRRHQKDHDWAMQVHSSGGCMQVRRPGCMWPGANGCLPCRLRRPGSLGDVTFQTAHLREMRGTRVLYKDTVGAAKSTAWTMCNTCTGTPMPPQHQDTAACPTPPAHINTSTYPRPHACTRPPSPADAPIHATPPRLTAAPAQALRPHVLAAAADVEIVQVLPGATNAETPAPTPQPCAHVRRGREHARLRHTCGGQVVGLCPGGSVRHAASLAGHLHVRHRWHPCAPAAAAAEHACAGVLLPALVVLGTACRSNMGGRVRPERQWQGRGACAGGGGGGSAVEQRGNRRTGLRRGRRYRRLPRGG